MDTKNLEAFVVVAELGSVTKAAKKLELTQSAVTKRITALESQLKIKLFQKVGTSVHITSAGTILLPFAHEVLLAITSGRKALFSHFPFHKDYLNLGVSYLAGTQRFPMLLKSFTQQFTDLNLNVKFLLPPEIKKALDTGDIEFCIHVMHQDIDKNYTKIKLWTYPLYFVVRKDHPILKEKKITLESLAKYPGVFSKPGMPIRLEIDKLFASKNLELDVGYEVNVLPIISQLLSDTDAWSVLPEILVNENLKIIDPIKLELKFDIYIMYQKKRVLSETAKKFIEILLSTSGYKHEK